MNELLNEMVRILHFDICSFKFELEYYSPIYINQIWLLLSNMAIYIKKIEQTKRKRKKEERANNYVTVIN